MSTFADHPLGNEAALDVCDLWRRVTENRSPEENHPEAVLKRLEENGLSVPLYNGEAYRNNQLIALGDLFTSGGVKLPERIRGAVRKAVANEIHPDVLAEWASPEQRKSNLQALCKRMGIKIPTPKQTERKHVLEFSSARALQSRIECWIGDRSALEQDYPRFCSVLDRLIESQLGCDYDEAFLDGTRQRLMLMAFYLGWKLDLPPQVTLELVKRARSLIWPGITE